MRFIQHYSSSTGNLYVVTASNGKRLLLECGVPWKKMQKALAYDLSNIVGCLVTHEHKDHCKAIHEVLAAGIDCYMSDGTRKALGLVTHRRATAVEHGKPFPYCYPFQVYPIRINHDAAEPYGFVVKDGNESLLFVPDTSHITQRFKLPFNIIALECSFDGPTLAARVEAGAINETLAKRLLTSHMEVQVTKRYLREFCDLSKCREIHLLHMSADNINADRIRKEFEDEFMIPTFTVGAGHGCLNTQG